MLDDQSFYAAGSQKQHGEAVGRELVYLSVVNDVDGKIFLYLGQYHFVRGTE